MRVIKDPKYHGDVVTIREKYFNHGHESFREAFRHAMNSGRLNRIVYMRQLPRKKEDWEGDISFPHLGGLLLTVGFRGKVQEMVMDCCMPQKQWAFDQCTFLHLTYLRLHLIDLMQLSLLTRQFKGFSRFKVRSWTTCHELLPKQMSSCSPTCM